MLIQLYIYVRTLLHNILPTGTRTDNNPHGRFIQYSTFSVFYP